MVEFVDGGLNECVDAVLVQGDAVLCQPVEDVGFLLLAAPAATVDLLRRRHGDFHPGIGYRVSVLTAARDDLAAENAELRSRVSTLSTEKTQLQEKANDLEARNEDLSGYLHDAIFLYNNIGFIVEGSNRYHNYDCPVFQGADEYWAHNIEYCEYLGYSKCGNCW